MSSDITGTVVPVSSSMEMSCPFIATGITMDGSGILVLILNNPLAHARSVILFYVSKRFSFLFSKLVFCRSLFQAHLLKVSFVLAKMTIGFFKPALLWCVVAFSFALNCSHGREVLHDS